MPAAPRMTAYLYDSTFTLIGEIGGSFGRRFGVVLNEAESFQLNVSRRRAPNDLIVGNFIQFRLNSQPVAHFVIEDVNSTYVDPDEVNLTLSVTGRGSVARLGDGKIVQPNGFGSSPPASTVYFNYAHPECVWPGTYAVTQRSAVGDLTSPPNGLVGGPFNFPNFLAGWIAPGVGSGADPVGSYYVRRQLEVAERVDVTCYATADDLFQLWFNGVQILAFTEAPGDAAGTTYFVQFTIEPGTHLFVARVENLERPGVAENCGLFAFGLESLLNSWLLVSDTSWETIGYTTTPPGFTIGKAVRLLVEAIQATGRLPGLTLNFSDTQDTRGTSWTEYAEITAKVGTDLFTTLRGYAELGMCDFRVNPSSYSLDMWQGGEQGTFYTTPTEAPYITGPEVADALELETNATKMTSRTKRL